MNALTKEFTDAVEAKLAKIADDLQSTREVANRADATVLHLAQKDDRGDIYSGNGCGLGPAAEFVGTKAQELAGLATEAGRGRVSLEVKAVTTAAGSAGAAVQPQRDTLLAMPSRALRVRSLLSVIPVTTGTVEYPRVTARPTNAAMVAEGALKPESDMTLEMVTVPIRKIAHWILASTEILADAPQLRGVIENELLYDLDYREDIQLLRGDGIGQNLSGLIPQAAAFEEARREAGDTRLDTIAHAILQGTLTDVPPDGIVVHPNDLWAMRRTKDGEGRYIMGDPMSAAMPMLWGLPVVDTKAIDPGDFLVGAFRAQTLYDRMTNTLLASTEDGTNFRSNLVSLLAEKRLGLAVKRASSLVYGAFEAA